MKLVNIYQFLILITIEIVFDLTRLRYQTNIKRAYTKYFITFKIAINNTPLHLMNELITKL